MRDALTVLAQRDIEAIHDTSLAILRDVGVSLPSREVLDTLAQAGADVDVECQVARFSDKAEVQVARLSGRAEVQVDRLSGHAVALDALPWDPAPGQPSWRRDHVAGHPFWRWGRAAVQVVQPEDHAAGRADWLADRAADQVVQPEDRGANQVDWLPDHAVDRVVEAGQRGLRLRRAAGRVEPRRRRPTHPLVAIRPPPATELSLPARLPMGCTATFGSAGNKTHSSPFPPDNEGAHR